MPQHAPAALKRLAALVDDIWHAAGPGFRFVNRPVNLSNSAGSSPARAASAACPSLHGRASLTTMIVHAKHALQLVLGPRIRLPARG